MASGSSVPACPAFAAAKARLTTETACVEVMPLGGKDLQPVLEALGRHRKYIRGEVAHAVNLKFAPDIRFLADDTFDEAQRIDAIFRSPKVAQDLKKS